MTADNGADAGQMHAGQLMLTFSLQSTHPPSSTNITALARACDGICLVVVGAVGQFLAQLVGYEWPWLV